MIAHDRTRLIGRLGCQEGRGAVTAPLFALNYPPINFCATIAPTGEREYKDVHRCFHPVDETRVDAEVCRLRSE